MLMHRLAWTPRRWARRGMSTETEREARAQMIRWTRISIAMLVATGVFTSVQYYAHANEDRGHELYGGVEPKYSYLKIRNKPFPWYYSDCDFLDIHCKQLARAAEDTLKKQ